jgi:hypothetical protein
VDYCLAGVLKIILQIQHAPFNAHAIPFRYVFEDVLTAKKDGVVLQAERGGMHRLFYGLRGRPDREIVGELRKGQQVSGHVTPAFEADPPNKWAETPLDAANIFVVSQAKGDSIGILEPDMDLIIPVDLVEMSYRVMDRPEIRERFPHLFPADENNRG